MADIHAALTAAARRVVRRRLIRAVSAAVLAALAAAFALIFAHKLLYVGDGIYLIAAALVLLAVPTGALWALASRPTPLQTALILDERLHLQERLSSAVATLQSTEPMAVALRADAAARLANADLTAAIPIALPRSARALPAMAAATILLAVLTPSLNLLGRGPAAPGPVNPEVTALRAWASSFAAAASKIGDSDELRFAHELQKLLRATEIRSSVLAGLAQARLEAAKIRDAAIPPDSVPRVSTDPAEVPTLQPLARAIQSRYLLAAADAAAGLAASLTNPALSDQDRQRIASDLKRLGSDPGTSPHLASELNRSADAMGENDLQAASEVLRDLARQLSSLARNLPHWQRMDEAMERLDRSLAALGAPIEMPPPALPDTPPAPNSPDLGTMAAGTLASQGSLPTGTAEADHVRRIVSTERSAAEQAVAAPAIPFAYREAVKRYFDSVSKTAETPR